MSNSVNLRRRYPGPRHFESAQSGIFFGRSSALKQVMEQIELRPHLVLYGKSGLGKSSLVNAGLLHALSGNRRVVPFNVRFGAHSAEKNQTPLSKTRDVVSAHALPGADDTFLSRVKPPNDVSLWFHLKQRQILSSGENAAESPRFLLVFDQFEELFTYPEADIERFAQQISELLFSTIPLRFRTLLDRELESGAARISAAAPAQRSLEDKLQLLERPLDIRLLFVIREDRMSLLNKISGPLPDILKHCYELQALDMTEAQEAIMSPAYLRDEHFESPIFDYRFEAVDHILNALTGGRKTPIESFQLQILCQSVEEKVLAGLIPPTNGRIEVDEQHIGDPKQIYEEYYEKKIQLITDPAEQMKARIFIEEGLIYEEEGRRLSLYEGVAKTKYRLSPELLKVLTDAYLIRAEAGTNKSGYSYELSHDTLVEPVLKAKAKRVQDEKKIADEKAQREREAAEEKARLEQEKEIADLKVKAEQERRQKEAVGRERDRAVRARKQARGLAIVAVVLAVSAGWGWWFAIESRQVAVKAKEQEIYRLFGARVSALGAKESEKKVRLQKAIVIEERNKAEEATKQKVKILQQLYSSNEKVAVRLVEESKSELARLKYSYAASNIKEAYRLGGNKPISAGMKEAILETAFFYTESDNFPAARDVLNSCGLGTPAINRNDLCAHLQRVDGKIYEALRKKYYPLDLVAVPSGTFLMGCAPGAEGCDDSEKQHSAQVGAFQISKSEVTFRQYNLYWLHTREAVVSLPAPSWGYDGDDPAVNVSWFDALQYANWASLRLGKKAIYTITGEEEGDWQASAEWSGDGFRLPTEAEWEYAARAGSGSAWRFSGGNDLKTVAWHTENSEQNGMKRTHSTRTKKPNELGLYDLTGNVWEWCWDWYAPYPESSPPDYRGPTESSLRTLRGGAFDAFEQESRVSFRNRTNPYLRSDNTGFRLVLPKG